MKSILFIVIQLKYVIFSTQSIAGVTYMDNFDFEERYRDVTACDPLYWHPLHLPAKCMDMFMKLIRSRVAKKFPVRVVSKNNFIYGMNQYGSQPFYPLNDDGLTSKSPLRQVLQLLQHDIKKHPVVPKMEMLPYLGLAAVYKQPISSKSEYLIQTIGNTYNQYYKSPDSYYLGKIEIFKAPDNEKSKDINPNDLENERKFVLDHLNKNEPINIKMQLKNGDTLLMSKKEINYF